MIKRTRKTLLTRAALLNAKRKIARGIASHAEYVGLVNGFEDGYRAALRDARKAFNAGRHSGNEWYFSNPMSEFVRPLR